MPTHPPAGEPVKFALLGSSISEPSRQGGYTDVTWHGLLHRWLELTFTPCGKQLGLKTVRTRQFSYDAHHRHSCNASSIKLVDLSMGATSAILTEKCLLKEDKVRGKGLVTCNTRMSPERLQSVTVSAC